MPEKTDSLPYKKVLRYVYAVLKAARDKFNTPLFTTAIQKLVYLTLASYNIPLLQKSYRAYYYGPYSDDVAYALDILINHEYVDCERAKFGVLYTATEKEAPSLTKEEVEVSHIMEKLSKIYENALKDTVWLSELAKTHFLWTFYPSLRTPKKLSKKAGQIGWNLPPEKIKKYLSVLRNANLLS